VDHYLVLMLDFIHRNLDNGAESAEQEIPGGGPQGGLLTVILFDLRVNLAGVSCPIYPVLPLGIAGQEHEPLETVPLGIAGPEPEPLETVPLIIARPEPEPLVTVPLSIAGPEPEPLEPVPLPLCHQKEKTMKKYVDDLSLLESIDLKATLVPSPPVIGPPNLHELPGLSLPPDL
jgi:hypothetical protein